MNEPGNDIYLLGFVALVCFWLMIYDGGGIVYQGQCKIEMLYHPRAVPVAARRYGGIPV